MISESDIIASKPRKARKGGGRLKSKGLIPDGDGPKLEKFECEKCGCTFIRKAVRGVKPRQCRECSKGPDPICWKTKKTIDSKCPLERTPGVGRFKLRCDECEAVYRVQMTRELSEKRRRQRNAVIQEELRTGKRVRLRSTTGREITMLKEHYESMENTVYERID